MCFPGKRQKDNFTEPKPTPLDTKAPANQPEHPVSPPVLPPLSSLSQTNMPTPRIAIVTYSLYGHITKSASSSPHIHFLA